ncbi:MAG TPA: Na+/H+ antiporter [Candidatus Sulfotelmatobacter sp.]|nr:Na+/H+ antiporter [Candidatus Sulfotelmatobacter sp.]
MLGGLLTIVLAGIVGLALLAKMIRVPYPVVFVLGGVVLALIPGVPTITLDPNLVFLLFLPPLIFGDGWTSDARALVRFRRPILSLSIGLVICTSAVVAFLAHQLIGLPLAVGFVLGGILSPTDAVATDAMTEHAALPKALIAIVGGESLVNDASGLVVYRFAIAALATGTFSLLAASVQFVYVIVAGIAVGLAGAWLLAKLMKLIRRKGLGDPMISVSISLITPFAVYVPADAIGASGVLASLAAGIALSRVPTLFDAESRLQAISVWQLLFFTFNGAAFALIGLQLREIVHGLSRYSVWTLIGWTLAITFTLLLVRFIWGFVALYLPYRLFPEQREGKFSWPGLTIIAFSGLRGIVSLAAALAIPTSLGIVPFPDRDLVQFLTFGVILVTLVGGGLLMPLLVRTLGPHLEGDGAEVERATALARVTTARAGRDRLKALESGLSSPADWEVAGRLEAEYDQRLAHFGAHADGAGSVGADGSDHATEQRLRREAYEAERAALSGLRRAGTIGDDVYRELEWEIDLAEASLGDRLQ